MQVQLRPYQSEAVKKVYAEFKRCKKVLLQVPTGGGKTIILSKISKDIHSVGKRVIILVHRKELIDQTLDKLAKYDITASVIQADYLYRPLAQVHIASVQTLIRRRMPVNIDVLITDECHHAISESYQKIYKNYPEAFHLGVTATPIRTSGEGFEDTYDSIVLGPTVKELIEQGYLVRPKIFANPLKFDLSRVKKTGGDYNERALYQAMQENFLIGNLVETWREKAEGKRTIVFAINVEHSQQIVQIYREAGVPAEHVDGTTPKDIRRAILRRFAEGKTLILSNVGIVTEGFDVPATECIQLVRPTKSLSLYLQMVGRGLRPADGKERAIVLDHSDSVFEHGFPEQDREWTLKGIVKQEKRKRVLMVNKEDQMIYEPKELPKHLKNIDLIEVDYDELRLLELEKHVSAASRRNFKIGYAWYKFLEVYKKPTVYEIDRFCRQAGYKPSWAFYKKKEFGYL